MGLVLGASTLLLAIQVVVFIAIAVRVIMRRAVRGVALSWLLLVAALPLVGALVYLISQGRSMADRAAQEVDAAKQDTDAYIRSVAAPGYRGVDEISRGKELLDRGAISQDEFDQLKRRALV